MIKGNPHALDNRSHPARALKEVDESALMVVEVTRPSALLVAAIVVVLRNVIQGRRGVV
jgi:hypothetical protein